MTSPESDLESTLRPLDGSEALTLLNDVAGFLTERDIRAYITGGWVRDVLLGRDTADIDIAVRGDGLEVARSVAVALGGRYVLLDSENGVGRVVLPGRRTEFDFTTLRGNIEEDLALRDFTVNAMAIDMCQLSGSFSDIRLIDPLNGYADLRGGIIRAVADTVFTSDGARLLRGVRLAAELGFTIDEKTETLLEQHSGLIAGVAGERVRGELLRLLAVPGAGIFVAYLDKLGLLTVIFPEMEQAKGVKQPGEHFWDVFHHSLRTVSATDFLLGEGEWEFGGDEVRAAIPGMEIEADYFEQEVGKGSTRKSLLRLAALLHDVSKPAKKTIEAGGRMRFLGHAADGAAVAAERLAALRFSVKEINLVEALILHHLRPTQMSNDGLPSNRAIYRYFRDTDEAAVDILLLSLADHLASRGPDLDPAAWREHTRLVDYVIRQRIEKEKIIIPPKLVSGYDIMNILGGSAGPVVGKTLEVVREAQAAGEVVTRQDALAFVEKLLAAPDWLETRNDKN
ncbi:MAG: HD domain-containing protein [Dehalococcoidales bacterium]